MAYSFNGTTQYLSIPDNSNLDVTGALTLACHFKSNSTPSGDHILVSKWVGTGNQRSYLIGLSANKIWINISNAGTSGFERFGATNVGTGQSHMALTYNPSTSFTGFLNGSADVTSTVGVPASIFNSTSNVNISRLTSGAFHFGGTIAEIGIWSATLTAAEVASLAKGMTCDKIRPQNLVFYAPLVRDLQDVRGGLAITNNNAATVATHPRVYA
jgi:hypothetical protein